MVIGDYLTILYDWGGVTTYAYDATSNRTLLVDPDGGRHTSTYDPAGRLSELWMPDGRRVTSQYDADGRKTTLQLALGSIRQYAYDANSRLTTQVELNPALAPISTFVDAYDAVGNRTGRVQDGVVTTWTYDKLYRLTGQQTDGAYATFSYDKVGNVLTKQHQGRSPQAYSYDLADRIVTAMDEWVKTFVYDAAGNLIVEDAGVYPITYAYDCENRLTQAQSYVGTSQYTYGADGLRRTKLEPAGVLTTMVWDGSDYLQERS